MYSLYNDYVFVFKYIGMSLQSSFLLLISEQLGILYGIFANKFSGISKLYSYTVFETM